MHFLIIEHFRNGDAAPVYARFRERGRLAPAGLTYVTSWVAHDLSRCYQVMECAERERLDEWLANWSDLVEFEVVPVWSSEQAARRVVELRGLRPDDAPRLLALFRNTVRRVNSRDYGPAQIGAWASEEVELEAWTERFAGRHVVVAECAGELAGFADLEPNGHLDRLFVSADHQRLGVGRKLLLNTVAAARDRELARVFAEVSITARPFFEAQGFRLLAPQTVVHRGVEFRNFRMELRLG